MDYKVKLSDNDNYRGYRFEYKDEEHFSLSDEQREKLIKLCIGGFRSARSFNQKHTSYGLKHIAEDILEFYVPNCEMKRAMIEAGFIADPYHLSSINWVFNIAESSPILRWNLSPRVKSTSEV